MSDDETPRKPEPPPRRPLNEQNTPEPEQPSGDDRSDPDVAIEDLTVHVLVKLIPRSAAGFDAFVQSIGTQGLLHPIPRMAGNVLIGGLTRLDACNKVGVKPRFVDMPKMSDAEVLQFIGSEDWVRCERTATQKGVYAVECYDAMKSEWDTKQGSLMNFIRRALGFDVSDSTITRVRKVRGDGEQRDEATRQRLWSEMSSGRTTVTEALAEVDDSKNAAAAASVTESHTQHGDEGKGGSGTTNTLTAGDKFWRAVWNCGDRLDAIKEAAPKYIVNNKKMTGEVRKATIDGLRAALALLEPRARRRPPPSNAKAPS